MYLKSLSLHGFKTFVTKTELEFKPGTTAVVGPNGCGKSNIFDALGWVLGESSVRSIRGRKMEEVIFHGSAAKKPLGYAQVQISFDNEDGFFPLPHSEVSILRRYYRSGESEFLINNQPCRLKDIQNLILDTGLGKMSYSFVSQGDVEYVINQSPQERREIFDEAAGINRYKSEKKKTLQKIKETDDNISRLNDILIELEERVGPLAEQAERARRFDELTEEIEKMKLKVHVSELRRLLALIEQSSIERREIEDQLALIKQKDAAFIKEREDQRLLLIRAKETLDTLADQMNAAANNLGRREEAGKFAEQNLSRLETQQKTAEEQRASESLRRKALEETVSQMESRIAAAREKEAAFRADLESILGAPEEDTVERERSLIATADKLRLDITELRDKQAALARERDNAAYRLATLADTDARHKKEKSRLESQLAELGAAEKKENEKREQNRAEEKRLDKEREAAAAEQEAVRKDLESFDETSREAASRLQFLRARLRHIEDLLRVGAARDSADTSWYRADGDAPPPKLEDILTIQPGYEAAVRRALGFLMDARLGDSADIVSRVQSVPDNGLALLIPGLFAPRANSDAKTLRAIPGAAGLLGDFVKCDGPLAGPIKRYLDSIVVIPDRSAIPEALKHLPTDCGIVCSTGDAGYRDGVVSLGEDISTARGMRALRETLAADIATAEKQAAENKIIRAESSRKAATVGDRIAAAEKQLRALRIARAESEARSNGAKEKEQIFRNGVESTDAALSENALLVEEFSKKKKAAEEALATVDASFADASKQLESVTTEARSLSDNRRKREDRLTELKIQIGEHHREATTLEDTRKYQQDDLARLAVRVEELTAQAASLVNERDTAKTRLAELREEIAGLDKTRVDAVTRLENERARVREIEKNIETIERSEETLRNQESELRDKIASSDIKRARSEAALEEMRRAFAEEFPNLSEQEAFEKAELMKTGEKSRFRELKAERDALLPVNQLAIGEYEETKARWEALNAQVEDLRETRATLVEMIEHFDKISREKFTEVFAQVAERFQETFTEFFPTGRAELQLQNPDQPLETGVDMSVEMPGKRMRAITLLSGGEKALCALTLIFAILKVKPSPFYLLDEVDAGLDEENVVKFANMLKRYSRDAQFLIISHNKGTLAGADHFYGITMEKDEGFSKVLSVSLE